MFDFFTKTEKQPQKKSKASTAKSTGKSGAKASLNFNQSAENSSNSSIKVFYPRSFEDVSEIIDMLIMGKPAIVNLKEIKENTAQRVLDILCGAVYALKGGLCELEGNIYVLTPDSVSSN
ncbi:MAG: cell division protein SepF [Clostridia bacterium]|nr:cell division protein SepF [Clostridia bacterium]